MTPLGHQIIKIFGIAGGSASCIILNETWRNVCYAYDSDFAPESQGDGVHVTHSTSQDYGVCPPFAPQFHHSAQIVPQGPELSHSQYTVQDGGIYNQQLQIVSQDQFVPDVPGLWHQDQGICYQPSQIVPQMQETSEDEAMQIDDDEDQLVCFQAPQIVPQHHEGEHQTFQIQDFLPGSASVHGEYADQEFWIKPTQVSQVQGECAQLSSYPQGEISALSQGEIIPPFPQSEIPIFPPRHVPPQFLWDPDWDTRECQFQRMRELYALRKTEPKIGHRHIFLIRHGESQRNEVQNDVEKELTCLGIEQAEATGRRLREYGFSYKSILYAAHTVEAMQTAMVLEKMLPDTCTVANVLLEEGYPILPEPLPRDWICPPFDKLRSDGRRMEFAFKTFFHRPTSTQGKCNSYEILVCPENVIRYFICRIMQFPPEAWARFKLYNCSITWIQLEFDGSVYVRNLGDFGHIPCDKLTN